MNGYFSHSSPSSSAGALLVSDVPRPPAVTEAARLTVVPLPGPSSSLYNPAYPSLGRLIPFPTSFPHLLSLIADAFALPPSSLTTARLYLDESHPPTPSPDPSHTPHSSPPTPQLRQQSFPLLRDNDVLLLHLPDSAAEPPSPSTPLPPLIAPPQPPSSSSSSSPPPPHHPTHSPPPPSPPHPTIPPFITQRFELTIIDLSHPPPSSASSHPTHPSAAPSSTVRFGVLATQPLRKLMRKYAEMKGWGDEANVLFVVRRRTQRGEGMMTTGERRVEEEEMELNGQLTCVQQGLSVKDVIYAYHR